jgi:hypothetical protein
MPIPHFLRYQSCLLAPFIPGLFSCIFVCRDLKEIGDPHPDVQQALAKQIRDACIDVGFFYGAMLTVLHIYMLIDSPMQSRTTAYLRKPLPSP